MTQSEFRDLIDRMSELNRRDPRAYRAKVRRFLRLGYWAYYGHLGLLLLCFVAMTVVTFVAGGRALVLLVPIAIAVVVVVRATFVVTTVPPGQSVSEDDAPGLFAALRRVCDTLKVQAPKTVLLDYRFNAMAASTFRFATFGAKSHVYFGVPLLQYLSPEEAECVLAHEVAHHIGRDVVIGAKESRLVQMWNQVLDKGRTGYSGAPMRPFFRWYMPRLEALSTVLKRENEHDADRLAASVMGVETSARSLMRIEVGASLWTMPFRDDYWKRSADLPEAPSQFLRSLESWPLPEPDKVAAAVMEACEATTGPYDSHPTLADRLTRIDRSLDPRSDDGRKRLVGLCREQPVERAMDAWFAPRSKAQFLKLFDIEIARAEDHDWNERRAVHLEDVARLEGVDFQVPSGSDAEDLWKTAKSIARVQGLSQAVPWAEAAYAADPKDPDGMLGLGTLFVRLRDPRAVDLLECASKEDSFEVASLSALYDYFGDVCDWDAQTEVAERLRRAAEFDEEIETWLTDIRATGPVGVPEMSPRTVAGIVEALKSDPEVTAAYTVCRRHPSRPRRKKDILVVAFRPKGFHVDRTKFLDPKLEHLSRTVRIPEGWAMWVVLQGSAHERAVAAVPGAEIHRVR